MAREEWLRLDAGTTRHLTTHCPYNRLCLDCAAKKKAQSARRKRADPIQETVPEEFGDLIAMDHLISRGQDAGLRGETAGLLVADIGTENLAFTPMKRRKMPQRACKHFGSFRGWTTSSR